MPPVAYFLDPTFAEPGLILSSAEFVDACEAASLIEDLLESPGLSDYHILERALARVNEPRRTHSGGARHEWVATPNRTVALVLTSVARAVRALQSQIHEIDRVRSLNLRAINELCDAAQLNQGTLTDLSPFPVDGGVKCHVV